MKPQKPQEQTEIKEELDIKQIKTKYGGEEYTELDYSVLIETHVSNKEGDRFNEDDYKKRLIELHEEMKNIKIDLNEARLNGRETGPLYKEKQNLEQKIHKVRQRLEQIKNKTDGQDDDSRNLEKAKLLTRQGIVNIRPKTADYAENIKRKGF